MEDGKCTSISVYDENMLFENSIRHNVNKSFIITKISKLKNLRYLNLRKSRLGFLPKFNCPNLEFLDISCNGIKDFPFWILDLHKLRYLNIGSNDISYIPNIEHLPLDVLKVHKNKISKFEGKIYPKIKFLNLYLNQMQEIPIFVFDLSSLEFLSFGGTKMSLLTNEFGGLKNLKWLCLVANNIKNIPDSFYLLNKLEGVKFAKNIIEEIPDFFGEMCSLKEISFYCNKIRTIPDSFFKMKLSKLNLRKNAIENQFRVRVLEQFRDILFLDI